MKTKSILTVSILILSFLILTAAKNIQEKKTFEGVYDGQEDYGYNFIGINSEGDEYTKTFQNIDEALLTTFDLHSEKLVGSKFSVTYTSKTEMVKDEDGYEEEVETNTILALKKM